MELFKAHRQWASRPSDQRFATLKAMHAACLAYANNAIEHNTPWSTLRVEADKGDVVLVGKKDKPAQLTHFAFGQLCGRVEAPANYLRELPATLAVQNLNHGLKALVKQKGDDEVAALMFHRNGGLLLRAVMTEKYSRVWNHEILERLLRWEQFGWEPARPDIRKEMGDFPALYASDHDMFAFLRNRQAIVREPGNPSGLQKGMIVENSEVGTSSIKMMRFLYREMCGNHIIWGASDVKEIKLKHVGSVRERYNVYDTQLTAYANESVSDEEAKIKVAKTKRLAATKEEVLDLLFGKRIGVSYKTLDASYDACLPDQDGDPKTVWGFVQGMTRYSQTIPYADQRTAVDKAAGKVMDFVF